jgi:hypothetical protein
MRKPIALIVATGIALLCHSVILYAQDQDPFGKVIQVPARYVSRMQEKFSNLDKQLSQRTEKYLRRLAKQEDRLKRSISRLDAKAAQPINNGQQFYEELITKVNTNIKTDKLPIAGEYLPYFDSVQTSLAFLEQNNQLVSRSKDIQQKLQGSLAEVKQFQAKLQQTERIREYVRQRKEQIRERLQRYTNLPAGIAKAYSGYTKELYYYSAQLKEYRDLANDPDKITKKALTLLRQSNAFQQFSKKYGQLAGLFNLPANYANAQSLTGLQTKAQVFGLVQNQLAGAGASGMQMLSQNIQSAQGELNKFKSKLTALGKGSGDMDLPDFKPNNQKTKSFWKRLEYGTNLQTTKSNFFPVTSDCGLSIGYKLNDISAIGIGASYKMGWGKDIKHISITNQGMGLRSYLDIKLKGSFFASGGFEYNYQPVAADSTLSNMHWNEIASWNKSGLIGISKIISINNKFFKKTKVQLLWDFLSCQQTPHSQPLKFRFGYNF